MISKIRVENLERRIEILERDHRSYVSYLQKKLGKGILLKRPDESDELIDFTEIINLILQELDIKLCYVEPHNLPKYTITSYKKKCQDKGK